MRRARSAAMLGSLFARTGDSRRAELDVLHAVTDAAQLPCQRPDLPMSGCASGQPLGKPGCAYAASALRCDLAVMRGFLPTEFAS
jgi:hypothetical protein